MTKRELKDLIKVAVREVLNEQKSNQSPIHESRPVAPDAEMVRIQGELSRLNQSFLTQMGKTLNGSNNHKTPTPLNESASVTQTGRPAAQGTHPGLLSMIQSSGQIPPFE